MGGDIGRDSVDRLGPASRNRYHAILSVQVRGRRGLVCRPSHLTCATPALPSLLFPFPRTIGPSAWNLSPTRPLFPFLTHSVYVDVHLEYGHHGNSTFPLFFFYLTAPGEQCRPADRVNVPGRLITKLFFYR